MDSQKGTPNRLHGEKSPYLLQHAYNPVQWYPWGEEAFEKAKREDKPVFLSIGYSTCHWCHVMAHESFENEEAAALLNSRYVPVKVDREERPDIDAVYMAVCQALTGAGGWPLTLLLTPGKKPFYAGTYLPLRSRPGAVGLIELLETASRLWREERERLLQTGEEVASFVARQALSPARAPEESLLTSGVSRLAGRFDPQNGGFGPAPKFPTPHNLLFLLDCARRGPDGPALQMAEATLTGMARGGIFDQVGGGFSRYSTDGRWLVPHFEKMLYDNALLACAYLEGYRLTGKTYYRAVAERTLDYLLRELAGPQGEFFCGQDADSDGVEGKYYLFTPQELQSCLGERAAWFCDWFDITDEGNFEGKNIPNLLGNDRFDQLEPWLAASCETVQCYRKNRASMHLDDKVLTSWNAMAVAALAKAFRITGDPCRLDAARRALQFVREHLTTPDGRLMIRWRDGEAAHPGQLDDYAYCLWALLELYAADYDPYLLSDAARLAGWMETLFWDRENGGFFLTASDAEQLIARPKELYDGAIPSGNSAAALGLILLGELTGEERWRSLADRQLAFLAGNIADAPDQHTFALLALARHLHPAGTLVCASAQDDIPAGLRELAEEWRLPVLFKSPKKAAQLDKVSPFTQPYPLPDEGVVYYYCRSGACQAPVRDLQALRGLLSR